MLAHAKAQNLLAECFEEQPRVAVRWLRRAADGGDTRAMSEPGVREAKRALR